MQLARKRRGCLWIASTYHDQHGAEPLYRGMSVTQLRHAFAAEQSAIVPDEGDNRRLIGPEVANPSRRAAWVG